MIYERVRDLFKNVTEIDDISFRFDSLFQTYYIRVLPGSVTIRKAINDFNTDLLCDIYSKRVIRYNKVDFIDHLLLRNKIKKIKQILTPNSINFITGS